jgi:hypothetical protein
MLFDLGCDDSYSTRLRRMNSVGLDAGLVIVQGHALVEPAVEVVMIPITAVAHSMRLGRARVEWQDALCAGRTPRNLRIRGGSAQS